MADTPPIQPALSAGDCPPAGKSGHQLHALARRCANLRRGIRELQRAYLLTKAVGDRHMERGMRKEAEARERIATLEANARSYCDAFTIADAEVTRLRSQLIVAIEDAALLRAERDEALAKLAELEAAWNYEFGPPPSGR